MDPIVEKLHRAIDHYEMYLERDDRADIEGAYMHINAVRELLSYCSVVVVILDDKLAALNRERRCQD